MTAAAAVFCCTIAVALASGFGGRPFTSTVASDAFTAAMPLLGVLLVARFARRRAPAREAAIDRVHCAAQGLLIAMAEGWWWVEPHAFLTAWTGGSLVAMAWQSAAGAVLGLVVAVLSGRLGRPALAREVGMASLVVFLAAGGYAYQLQDHVESGMRLQAGGAVVAIVALLAAGAYRLLRDREKVAAAIPGLAPALACAALLLWPGGVRPVEPTGDSVLLIVVDTLRADIADAGMDGNGRVMPELERIAGDGVRFTQAVSPAPWTLPAVVSLLGGWNPHRHGYGASRSDWEVARGDPAAFVLPGALREAGYMTAAFVNNPWLRPWFGFGDGFYRMRPYHGRAVDGVSLALGWLGDRSEQASFTLLHLMDPHWPYDAPPGFGPERGPCRNCESLEEAWFTSLEGRDEIRRRYAAEVAYTDSMLGRLYDALLATGCLERTWLVVTSDHGEEFWEHGRFLHGHSLFDEQLRVPLVVVPPRGREQARRGVRVEQQVRLEDVAATMMEVTGLDPALARDGRSLLPLMAGQAESHRRTAVAGFVKFEGAGSYAVRRPPWKAIVTREMSGNQLFRLDDEGERRNLLYRDDLGPDAQRRVARAWFALFVHARQAGYPLGRRKTAPSGARPDADVARRLRSLGYSQ